MMVSYAQNGEDVVLRRVFSGVTDGFYIDVGAADPTENSVTRHFYENGWKGINIEPQPQYHARLRERRIRDINLQMGISNQQSTLPFYQCLSIPEWSTFSQRLVADLATRQGMHFVEHAIPVRTLASICEEHVHGPIHFLKVDAEEHEREVILGHDWNRYRPIVVVIEASNWETWDSLICGYDYQYCMEDSINRYYVRNEDRGLRALLSYPAAVRDDFVLYRHLQAWEAKQIHVDAPLGLWRSRKARFLARFPILRGWLKRAS